jgi:hypothetical protein
MPSKYFCENTITQLVMWIRSIFIVAFLIVLLLTDNLITSVLMVEIDNSLEMYKIVVWFNETERSWLRIIRKL